MENEQQLQLGPVEENPTKAAPNVELEFTPEELDSPVMPFSTSPVDTFAKVQEDQVLPALTPQLEATADIVNTLGATTRYADLEDMRRAFNEELHGSTLDEALHNLSLLEGSARKQRTLEILNRSDLAVEDRLNLVRQFERDSQLPDTNIIERNYLRKVASEEHSGFDDESDAAFAQAAEYVEGLPRLAAPELPADVTKEEMRMGYEQLLNMHAQDAEDRRGILNFMPNLMPFYSSVPITRIMKRLNEVTGETEMPVAGAALMNGTALRVMRDKVETLPLEQKIEFLGKVLKVLKPNGDLLHHENAHLTAYVLQNLFYKDLTGEDMVKTASDADQKAYFAALSNAEHFERRARAATDGAQRAEYQGQANVWHRKATEIAGKADGRMWDDYNRPTIGQWLDDMAILDFIGLGPLALRTIKMGQKGGMSAFRRLARVAPDAAAKKAIDALPNPRVRAQMGKLRGEDVAETFLPSALKGAEEAGINGMGELMARVRRIREEVTRTLIEGSHVTARQQQEFASELQQILGTTSKAALHVDKSTFTIGEQGVDYIVRYGRTDTKPFAQVGTARKALADMPAHARVVQLDRATGKYKVVGDSVNDSKRGEFYVAYGDSRTYDASRHVWEEAVFPRAQVRDPWFLKSSVAPLAKLWNWFVPTDSMFGKGIANEIVNQSMRSPVLQRLHMDTLKTLTSLPTNDQYIVSALLKQGEEMGTTFTVQQIRTLFPKASDKVVKGYYEARMLADNMFEVANIQQRTEWFRAGVKQIVSGGDEVGYGKLLSSADDAIGDIKTGYQKIHAYDPVSGQFVALSRSDIDGLYKKGQSLARLEDLMQGKGFAEATHVLLDGKATRLRELPRQVLRKVPGYYPHIFQGNHVIYGVSKAGNKVALAVAKTIGDAKSEVARISRIMQRMGAKAPYEAVDYRFDRSLRDPLVSTKEAADPIFGATQKVYGQRSGRMIRNASKAHGDHMVDPIEALLRGMELVSHSVTKGNLIKHMEQRLQNTLRLMERETGQTIIKDPRKVVKTADDINYVSTAAKDHRKVLAYMQQIDMVRHIPDAVERQMAIGLVWAAEMFDGLAARIAKLPLGKGPAQAIDNLGGRLVSAATKGTDPTRLLTEFAHRVYIASNPLQQFALQLSQSLILTGLTPKQLPIAVGRSVPLMSLLYGRVYNAAPEAYEKALSIASKATGMKVGELRKLVGVLERSGLLDSVAMHTQIRTTARTQAHTRMLASASAANKNTLGRVTMESLQELDEAVYGNLSRLGFEAGEQFNRVITFMSLYQRDKKAGKAMLDSPAYIQDLVGEVNTLVGSMLRETSMGYQRGWLKAAFQFVAFQHKMAALTLTNKTLSWQQKASIALTQFALFGSRGAFHLDAAHRAFDGWIKDYEAANPDDKSKMVELYYHPNTQSALDGLVFDMGVNEIMRVAAGKDTPDFAWNERIAPGGGSELMAQTLIELRNNPTEKVFGLGGKQGSKVVEFFDHVRRVMLAQSRDMDDVPIGERVQMMAKEGLSLAFSGYDKYLAASAAQKMGGWVTDTGNVVDGSDSNMEYYLAAALGVTTQDRQAYYDLTDQVYADIRNDPKRHKEALDDIADKMFKRMVDEHVKLNAAASPEVLEAMEGKLQQQQALLLSFLTPREQEAVSERIGDKIAELIKGKRDSAQEAFYRNLVRDLEDTGMMDKEALELGVYLRRSPLFQTYPQLQSDFQQKLREISEYEDK